MKKWTVIILLAIVALVVVPLVLHPGGGKFGGADNKATSAIKSIDPGYKPWFKSIWKPPTTEMEGLLFALQAAVGAGVVCFAMGFFIGRAKGRKQVGGPGDAVARGRAEVAR